LLLEATAVIVTINELINVSDWDGDGLWYFFLGGLHLFNHLDGSPFNRLKHVLQLRPVKSLGDKLDQLCLPLLLLHLSLLDHADFLDNFSDGLFAHLLYQDDLGDLLLLLPQNGLLLTNRLRLVLDLLLHPGLFLQLESLDDLLDGPEHLLLSFDRLHLPLGLLSCAVLVLLMYMAVLVDVELVGLDAAGACAQFTAGFLLNVVPESASLVVAAATTPGSATRATALAVWLLGVCGILEAIG